MKYINNKTTTEAEKTRYEKGIKEATCTLSQLEGNHSSSKADKLDEAEAALKDKSTSDEERHAALEFVRTYHAFEVAKK